MGKTCTELFAGIDCTILGNADDELPEKSCWIVLMNTDSLVASSSCAVR